MSFKKLAFWFGVVFIVPLVVVVLLVATSTEHESVEYTRGGFNDFIYTPDLLDDLLPEKAEGLVLTHSFRSGGAPEMDGARFVDLNSERAVIEPIDQVLLPLRYNARGAVEYDVAPNTPDWKTISVQAEDVEPGKTKVTLWISHVGTLMQPRCARPKW